MAWLPMWVQRFGTVGATENAARMCAERQQEERVLEERLASLRPVPVAPERRRRPAA